MERIEARLQKLERQNRILIALVAAVSIMAIVGWQSTAKDDTLRVHRLEVVDSRGVPMVILEPDRNEAGGAITLRDKDGEKRAWWKVSPEGGHFSINAEGGPTVGFGTSKTASELTLVGPKGGSLSASLDHDAPRLDLFDPNGALLFGAPWRKP